MDTQIIHCPHCGEAFDVNEQLSKTLQDDLRKEFIQKELELKAQLDNREQALRNQLEQIQQREQAIAEKIQTGVKESLKLEKTVLEKKLRSQIQEEQAMQVEELQKQLSAQSSKVKELFKAQADVMRLQREKDELADKLKAEAQQLINETLDAERQKIKQAVEEAQELKIKDKEHVINQLRDQLKAAQQKAEQGSMQSQGEVQELAIEEWLISNFPLDDIGEIKKGVLGGDCLQTVNTRTRMHCGKIYYESKRTKDFQSKWIAKFKSDMIAKGADIGILVTQTMPKELDRFGEIEGVWICTYNEFKGLAPVLRQSLIKVSDVIASQENKGDKMSLLYQYLTSNEFRLTIETIISNFTEMKSGIARERRSMEALWKQREKQVDAVLLSTANLFGSVKGIAGADLPEVKLLDLDNS